jgi:hypothetical protein
VHTLGGPMCILEIDVSRRGGLRFRANVDTLPPLPL